MYLILAYTFYHLVLFLSHSPFQFPSTPHLLFLSLSVPLFWGLKRINIRSTLPAECTERLWSRFRGDLAMTEKNDGTQYKAMVAATLSIVPALQDYLPLCRVQGWGQAMNRYHRTVWNKLHLVFQSRHVMSKNRLLEFKILKCSIKHHTSLIMLSLPVSVKLIVFVRRGCRLI